MLIEEVPTKRFLPTLPRSEPRVKDHTATQAFKQCPRKYFYRFVLGRVAPHQKNQQIFDWGNAVHKFCEVLYEEKDYELASVAGLRLFKAPGPDSNNKFLDATRLLKTFHEIRKLWEKEQEEGFVQVIGVEQPFNVELPNSVQTGGRFDLVLDINGQIWPRDWKTTTKQINMFATNLNPNDQAIRYVYALSRLRGWTSDNPDPSKKVEGILYHVICNMSSVGPKLQSIPVTFSTEQLIEWEKNQEFLYRFMSQCRQQDLWPQYEGNCGWCDYVSICRASTDKEREYRLKANYTYKPWNHMKVEQD